MYILDLVNVTEYKIENEFLKIRNILVGSNVNLLPYIQVLFIIAILFGAPCLLCNMVKIINSLACKCLQCPFYLCMKNKNKTNKENDKEQKLISK